MAIWVKYSLAVLPLLPCLLLFLAIKNNEFKEKIYVLMILSLIGYLLVDRLVPIISQYTLKRGLCGKDLGKKGTINESVDVPEALGIVSGIVFLVCAILSSVVYFSNTSHQQMIFNSALFSICFMIFLGFTDDTLDLQWRYKLILPLTASIPLLTSYSGETAVLIPAQLRFILWNDSTKMLTTLGSVIDTIFTVDTNAEGKIIELGPFFFLYMSLLSVFCTNSINILAGVNGLECGQAYIIAVSILFFKLYDIYISSDHTNVCGDNQLFAIIMILPFIATSLGLLRHNWYPAKVFVGDTYCYFAGMTFAVIGIHGHFSKTLLLLFLPQIFNFLYSIPQLFKVIPCPRHRLPHINVTTRLMSASTFECKASDYQYFKSKRGDVSCPNYTLICLILQVFGPMYEETLTTVLLGVQVTSTIIAFCIRYYLLHE